MKIFQKSDFWSKSTKNLCFNENFENAAFSEKKIEKKLLAVKISRFESRLTKNFDIS